MPRAKSSEACLAHTISDALEAAYRRGDFLDKRRRLMEAWAEYCGMPGHGRHTGAAQEARVDTAPHHRARRLHPLADRRGGLGGIPEGLVRRGLSVYEGDRSRAPWGRLAPLGPRSCLTQIKAVTLKAPCVTIPLAGARAGLQPVAGHTTTAVRLAPRLLCRRWRRWTMVRAICGANTFD